MKQLVINFLPHGIVKSVVRRKEQTKIKSYVEERQADLKRNVREYSTADQKLINFGCGKHYQNGWINIDYDNNGDINLAFERDTILPFPDNSIDAIFSEHFIEHIDFETGNHYVSESFRVLKKGGVLRTITPDLSTLKSLNEQKLKRLKEMFISVGDFNRLPDAIDDAEIINWMFYGHGHKFVYDEITLKKICIKAGFKVANLTGFGKSCNEAIAIERRKEEEFYSLYLDAVK